MLHVLSDDFHCASWPLTHRPVKALLKPDYLLSERACAVMTVLIIARHSVSAAAAAHRAVGRAETQSSSRMRVRRPSSREHVATAALPIIAQPATCRAAKTIQCSGYLKYVDRDCGFLTVNLWKKSEDVSDTNCLFCLNIAASSLTACAFWVVSLKPYLGPKIY